jgi:hypothetical protein
VAKPVSTVGHKAALRRWRASYAEPDEAKAVALVTVAATSLYSDKHGLERGSSALLAIFGNRRLLMVRPTRKPDPKAVLLDFAKGSYRITEVERGKLNASFRLSRPYGSVDLRMSRIGDYSDNDEVLDRVVAAADQAARAAARKPAAPLLTAGDVRVFARMCAAYGPGAERATAVAEAVVAGGAKRLMKRQQSLLLAAFPDRLVLLDPEATTHAGSTPTATFTRGSTRVTVAERTAKHLDVALADGKHEISLRVALYDAPRIDDLVVDAIQSVQEPH